jgi:hypothetical protein
VAAVFLAVTAPGAARFSVVVLAGLQVYIHRLRATAPAKRAASAAFKVPKARIVVPHGFGAC